MTEETNNQPADNNPDVDASAVGGATSKTMNRRRMMKWTAATGAGLVAGGIGALNTPSVQRALILSPEKDFAGNDLPPMKEPSEYGLQGVKSQILDTAAGDTFTTWQSETLEPGKKTLVLFPGNGGHLGYSPETGAGGMKLGEGTTAYIDILKEALEQGYQVIAANPVGFAGSSVAGNPTEENMYAGAEATIDYALQKGIASKDLHITGVSMGTALAAHAANHLAQQVSDMETPDGKVNLTLASGLINVREGLEEFALIPNLVVAKVWDNLDAGKELQALARRTGKQANVAFVRGAEDPATPENQKAAHQRTARGTNFRAEDIEGASHYVTPKDILRQFDELERGNTSLDQPVRGNDNQMNLQQGGISR